eukprot:2543011-Pyramimonas_sp.AAC.1
MASYVGELALRCTSVSERRHVKAYVHRLLAGCLIMLNARVECLERLADNINQLEQSILRLQTHLNICLTGVTIAELSCWS